MTVTISLLIAAALIGCDQLIKAWAVENLQPVGTIQLIPGLVKLTYVENRGAAFGIMDGYRTVLIVVTAVILIAACYLLVAKKVTQPVMMTSVALILAGGTGNLVDRIIRGFVVDYIDINELFTYPMFNLADCCVVGGAILLAVYMIFFEGKTKGTPPAEEEPPPSGE